MNPESMIFLLMALMSINSLFVEAIKKSFQHIPTNIICLVSAIGVGVIGTVFYYLGAGIPINGKTAIYILPMIAFVWCGSMVGYDKVIQTIKQYAQK